MELWVTFLQCNCFQSESASYLRFVARCELDFQIRTSPSLHCPFQIIHVWLYTFVILPLMWKMLPPTSLTLAHLTCPHMSYCRFLTCSPAKKRHSCSCSGISCWSIWISLKYCLMASERNWTANKWSGAFTLYITRLLCYSAVIWE